MKRAAAIKNTIPEIAAMKYVMELFESPVERSLFSAKNRLSELNNPRIEPLATP